MRSNCTHHFKAKSLFCCGYFPHLNQSETSANLSPVQLVCVCVCVCVCDRLVYKTDGGSSWNLSIAQLLKLSALKALVCVCVCVCLIHCAASLFLCVPSCVVRVRVPLLPHRGQISSRRGADRGYKRGRFCRSLFFHCCSTSHHQDTHA